MSDPDRPGDRRAPDPSPGWAEPLRAAGWNVPDRRDQQQAVEPTAADYREGAILSAVMGARYGRGNEIARALAAARAEEAARWRAKIEALADSLETDYKGTKFDDGALLACDRLRALLDDER